MMIIQFFDMCAVLGCYAACCGKSLTAFRDIVPKRYILLTVHHVIILGKWPTWCTDSFLCVYFYLWLSTCFEHFVLIIRRDKLYQYCFW